MLNKYKKYTDSLAKRGKENGPEHSLRTTEDKIKRNIGIWQASIYPNPEMPSWKYKIVYSANK